MNLRLVLRTIGYVLFLEAFTLVLPLVTAIFYGESILPYLFTIAILLAVAAVMVLAFKKGERMYAKEGFLIVALSWIAMSLFGALPFYFSGEIGSYVDCVFETISGFTTTGASILNDIESLPKGLLFWRSFTHWIGGMGVLVFVMAIIPMSGDRSMHVLRAEMPGPSAQKLVPKARKTALILYGIYIFLTLLEVVFLLFGGMPFFDSVVNSLATAGTGGFAIKNASIGAYNSPYAEVIITIFMLAFGVNFNVYFLILLKDVKSALKSEELRTYLITILCAITLICINTFKLYDNFWDNLRQTSFQVASIISTTGFATTDYDLWPTFSKAILFILMVLGACGGSTGGGLKTSRYIILNKKLMSDFSRLLHPRQVKKIKLEGKTVDDETVSNVLIFFVAYVFIAGIVTLIISIDGFDLTTNISAVISCLSNIGPGFNVVGPTGNFASFSPFSKLVLSFAMLLGRLEIFPLVIAFEPFFTGFKRKKSKELKKTE